MARFNNIAVRDTEYYTPKHFRKADQPIEDEWSALIAAEVARRAAAAAPEPAPKAPKPAPKAPKPKAERKSETMPDAPAGWWNEWFDKPWVKHGRVKANSSIVKLVAEGSHGAELRAAGWQYSRKAFTKPDGKKVAGYWWAYKDADKARERGERYLARKAERQAS